MDFWLSGEKSMESLVGTLNISILNLPTKEVLNEIISWYPPKHISHYEPLTNIAYYNLRNPSTFQMLWAQPIHQMGTH